MSSEINVTLFKGGSKETTVDLRTFQLWTPWSLLSRLQAEGKITEEEREQLWELHCIAQGLHDHILLGATSDDD